MNILKKDYKKEFVLVREKLEAQVQKLNGEILAHKQEIAKVEEERSTALAELDFGTIQGTDEKIEDLKKVIAQKERFIAELNPKKSVALQRVAVKALDEIAAQTDKRRKESEELQKEIDKKIVDLLALIDKGDGMNDNLDEISADVQPFLAVFPSENKQGYKEKFYDYSGHLLKLFPRPKYNKLVLDLQHFEQFNINKDNR